jgi:hypothetical protein
MRSQFHRRARMRTRAEPGAYRRISGYADDGEEEAYRCFRRVICLVQAGCPEPDPELLASFFAMHLQNQHPVAGYWELLLSTFDGTATLSPLPGPDRASLRMGGAARRWMEAVVEGVRRPAMAGLPLVIPALVGGATASSGTRPRPLGEDDLVLVFCGAGQAVFATSLAGDVRHHGKRLVVVEVAAGALEVRFDEGVQLVGP